jgi:hypothetical protein
MIFDYIMLEQQIDNTVINLVSLFNNTTVTNINDAKRIIKDNLIINSSTYKDYYDLKFKIISILITKAYSSLFEEFYEIFLSSTFLLESVIKVDERNTDLCEKISDNIINLYNVFKQESTKI